MAKELLTEDFNYDLPEELIASMPRKDRDGSRMMVIDRATGKISCRTFGDFKDYIGTDDICVLNDTKVVPSRFFNQDGKIEIIRLEEPEPNVWKCLVRPGKKMRVDDSINIAGVDGTVEKVLPDGERVIRFSNPINIEKHGELALPHYMKRDAEPIDQQRYQTVYAKSPGAIAAPTAGLHFTPELLESIPHTFITLHVGVGTFQPVRADRIIDHKMHSERFHLSKGAALAISSAKRRIAVGTTVTRVLEHLSLERMSGIKSGSGETNIFIYPSHKFLGTDALLTNFHLPKSTLFMLVCALAGTDLMKEAYRKAVLEKFRFFSYGDCCLII
ncbi:MAG: tRNA preQ1(34) S-adenosylmethionine ribosyltransferase-isomerase QueA [Verrucomicrobiota bacterium]|nr:tRNA preQ1(34) S-adenosylmethionine ribosyltransferase-isomerase QueA [Verrucomicrobiota bacterium]